MRFNQATQEYFLGPLTESRVGYSADPEIRARSASGGLVSSILIHLLETGRVQGALVCRLEVADGELEAKPFIATSREEILSAGGSIYLNVNPLSDRELIEGFGGKLAMVGLPCHLDMLERLGRTRPELAEKIDFTIGLFCGHNSGRELIETVLAKKRVDMGEVSGFRFRRGLWRGRSWLHFRDGRAENFPFQAFSRYQNLHFFTLRRCLSCADHTAESADLSVGDLWSKRFKEKPIKHSAALARNDKARDVIREMESLGLLNMEDCEPGEIFEAQKRALTCHKSLYARHRLAPFFGLKTAPAEKTPTPWNHWLATAILLFNARWSQSPRYKKFIFMIPKHVLQAYLVFFKGLTHIGG